MAIAEMDLGEAPSPSIVDRVIDLARTGVARLGSFALLVASGAAFLNTESDLEGLDPLDTAPDYMSARVLKN